METELQHRVVLLGASNLTRGISTVAAISRRIWGPRLEILAAMGHGRSYGRRSSVLIRALPGITECGIWNALAQGPAKPTAALVTDIGNDIIYHQPVPRILEWITLVLDRLEQARARVVLTLPPVCNLDAAADWKVQRLIKLLYPKYSLAPETLVERVRELDLGLREIALHRGLRLIEPRADWYGFDPIHFRRAQFVPVWTEILSQWSETRENCDRGLVQSATAPTWREWVQLRSSTPELMWVAGREWRNPQPARRLRDGTTVAFY